MRLATLGNQGGSAGELGLGVDEAGGGEKKKRPVEELGVVVLAHARRPTTWERWWRGMHGEQARARV